MNISSNHSIILIKGKVAPTDLLADPIASTACLPIRASRLVFKHRPAWNPESCISDFVMKAAFFLFNENAVVQISKQSFVSMRR